MKVSDLIYRHEAIRTITSYNGTVDKSVAKRLLLQMLSAQPEPKCNSCRYRNLEWYEEPCDSCTGGGKNCHYKPEPERLTDDDFETIRIHLNAYKEKLCNQHRWKEAEEYQRIIDRFMSFASAEPERKKGKWIGYKDDDPQWKRDDGSPIFLICSECGKSVLNNGSAYWNFCPNCGSYNGGEQE